MDGDVPGAAVHAKLRQCEQGVADLKKMQEQIDSLTISPDALLATGQMQHLEFVHNIEHFSVKEEQSMIRTLRRLRQTIKDKERKERQRAHLRSQMTDRTAHLHEEVHLMLNFVKAYGRSCSCFAGMSRWCHRTCATSRKWRSQLDMRDGYGDFCNGDLDCWSDFWTPDPPVDENEDGDNTLVDGYWYSWSRAARASHNRNSHLCRNWKMASKNRRRTLRKDREGGRCKALDRKDFILQ